MQTDPFAGQWRDITDVLTASQAASLAAPMPAAGEEPAPHDVATPTASGVAPLSKGERVLLYLTGLLATAVSVLGLLSSYTSLERKGAEWGWEWPWLLPAGMDLSIPAFTLAGLLLIRTNMPLVWVALVPRALTGASVYLNWNAATTLPGQIGHAVLTLLWVVFSEIAGHVYASQVGLVTGTRMEKIRRIRWILAPLSTAAIWRRMNLWEETSYRAALHRQRTRLLARAGLRETHGRTWRWSAPRRDRVLLRLGDLNPADVFLQGTETSGLPETVTAETTPEVSHRTKTEITGLAGTPETGLRETTSLAARQETGRSEAAVSLPSRGETETVGLPGGETTRAETKRETATVSRPAGRETETQRVSPIGDRHPEAEIGLLLALMRDRGSETAVGLTDAIAETGRPKATAAKRLKVARDRYRAETAA